MSGGYDSLEALSEVYGAGSYLTEEQRAAEEARKQQEQAAALSYVNTRAAADSWADERRDEILQALGLVAYTGRYTFGCGCERTEANSVPDSKPGSFRCRFHKSEGDKQRAALRHPRNKQGAA